VSDGWSGCRGANNYGRREGWKNGPHLAKVASSLEFRVRQRKCLFLGLSDGSHTDVFRRSNSQLSNEQVRQSHELTKDRIDDLRKELKQDLGKLLARDVAAEESVFRSVVLLDDFSASGVSYIRKRGDGTIGGKVGRFFMQPCRYPSYL
jgi:hypothetical protein